MTLEVDLWSPHAGTLMGMLIYMNMHTYKPETMEIYVRKDPSHPSPSSSFPWFTFDILPFQGLTSDLLCSQDDLELLTLP